MQEYIFKVDSELKKETTEMMTKKQLEKEMNNRIINELEDISEYTDIDKISNLDLESKNSNINDSSSISPSRKAFKKSTSLLSSHCSSHSSISDSTSHLNKSNDKVGNRIDKIIGRKSINNKSNLSNLKKLSKSFSINQNLTGTK